MLPINYYKQFQSELKALPLLSCYPEEDLKHERFRILRDGELDVYYAPFHHLNRGARVVLVGVTPGFTQMEGAFRAAKVGMAKGLEDEDLFRFIETSASFSGRMRAPLVEKLDELGLNEHLNIRTCNDLFDHRNSASRLANFDSAISAPVFRNGENYTGYSPRLVKRPKLRAWVLENLAVELRLVPEALVVPFGPAVEEAVQLIGISPERVLSGFPHLSGSNGHKKEMFRKGRERWRRQIAQIVCCG